MLSAVLRLIQLITFKNLSVGIAQPRETRHYNEAYIYKVNMAIVLPTSKGIEISENLNANFQLVLAMPTSLQHGVLLSHQLPMNHDNKLFDEEIEDILHHTGKRLLEDDLLKPHDNFYEIAMTIIQEKGFL